MNSGLNPWFSVFGMKWFIIVMMWTKMRKRPPRIKHTRTHTYPNQKKRAEIGIWILTVFFSDSLRYCWISFPLRTTHCHWKSFWIQMFIQTMQKRRIHSVLKSNRNTVLQVAGTHSREKCTKFTCRCSSKMRKGGKNYQEGCDALGIRLKGKSK